MSEQDKKQNVALTRLLTHWQFLGKLVERTIMSNNYGLISSMADTLEQAVSEWQHPSERAPMRGSAGKAPEGEVSSLRLEGTLTAPVLATAQAQFPPEDLQAVLEYVAAHSGEPVIITSDIVDNAIQESVGGITTDYRTKLRVGGIVNETLSVKVPLTLIQQQAQARIDGLHSDQVILTIAHLRERLGKMGVSSTTDYATLDVQVPPPRSAHAR